MPELCFTCKAASTTDWLLHLISLAGSNYIWSWVHTLRRPSPVNHSYNWWFGQSCVCSTPCKGNLYCIHSEQPAASQSYSHTQSFPMLGQNQSILVSQFVHMESTQLSIRPQVSTAQRSKQMEPANPCCFSFSL